MCHCCVLQQKWTMSTQSYYKERLGFDPREALYDGPVKGSRGHSQTTTHYVSNGNGNGNNDHYATPPKKHKQQHHASYQQQHEDSQTGGYEDALTQFKGSMSLWEYFVENSDKMGMSVLRVAVSFPFCCENLNTNQNAWRLHSTNNRRPLCAYLLTPRESQPEILHQKILSRSNLRVWTHRVSFCSCAE